MFSRKPQSMTGENCLIRSSVQEGYRSLKGPLQPFSYNWTSLILIGMTPFLSSLCLSLRGGHSIIEVIVLMFIYIFLKKGLCFKLTTLPTNNCTGRRGYELSTALVWDTINCTILLWAIIRRWVENGWSGHLMSLISLRYVLFTTQCWIC